VKVKSPCHSIDPEPKAPACLPNWSCTEWQTSPETIACGETFTQTRECTDLNNCETQDGKPSESQEVIGIKDCSPTLNE